jgi:alanyl-tRNA synthetase
MLSDDMVKNNNLHAGQIVREAAKLIQGGGGGQPHYASAGGKDISRIGEAVEKVVQLACL